MNRLAIPSAAAETSLTGRTVPRVLPTEEDVAGGLPRSFLRPSLLLLLGEGPSHGYELLEHARRLGLRGAEPGGLYRSLRAMEREGLVHSRWERSQSGPARRTYLLTRAGLTALDASAATLSEAQRLISSLLERHKAFGGHRRTESSA
ncbi:MAG: PadR family transcriptional regulator [Pseudonocardiaceae bacterium]|nr:PadR family transcriptional regulator [Pseudonocardiaceae bacterium]